MSRRMTRRTLMAGAALAQAATPQQPQQVRLPKKVRLGIIGLEGHTGEMLTPMKWLPDVELVAISDPDPKRMQSLVKRYPGVKTFQNYHELLASVPLDVAGVCGDNGTRAGIIVECANRKLHIVAEKPLAIEWQDLHRIEDALKKNAVRLSMLLPMRFYPAYMAIKQVIDAGQIGEVAQIDAQKSYKLGERSEWMKHRSSFGGTIPYIGVHMVDLMCWASGRDLVEAMSFAARVGYPDFGEMENTTATVFKLDNGGVAVLHMDYLRPETAPTHGDDRLRIAGTKGVVEYQEATGVTVVTGNEKPRRITELPAQRWLFQDFLEAAYQGKPEGLTWKEIMRVNQIVLGAREAQDRHRVVRLERA